MRKDQSKVLWSVLTINANTFVLAAAGVVGFTNPTWPDIVVGSGITILFFKSEINVLAGARLELAHEAGMRAWI